VKSLSAIGRESRAVDELPARLKAIRAGLVVRFASAPALSRRAPVAAAVPRPGNLRGRHL